MASRTAHGHGGGRKGLELTASVLSMICPVSRPNLPAARPWQRTGTVILSPSPNGMITPMIEFVLGPTPIRPSSSVLAATEPTRANELRPRPPARRRPHPRRTARKFPWMRRAGRFITKVPTSPPRGPWRTPRLSSDCDQQLAVYRRLKIAPRMLRRRPSRHLPAPTRGHGCGGAWWRPAGLITTIRPLARMTSTLLSGWGSERGLR